MKRCPHCGLTKDESEFYKQPNGRPSQYCRPCTLAVNKAWRDKHREQLREYDAARAMRPDRIALRQAYITTAAGRASRAATQRRWESESREKRRAETICKKARASGQITPTACVSCGATSDIVGHHVDYSAPLQVVWLCQHCHSVLHNEHRRMLRGLRLPAAPRSLQATAKDRE